MSDGEETLLDELWPVLAPPEDFSQRVADACFARPQRARGLLKPILLVSAVAAVALIAPFVLIRTAPTSNVAVEQHAQATQADADLGVYRD